jgi:hypothetical protein
MSAPSEPKRLVADENADPTLARLGHLVRDASRPAALPEAALERVFHRLTRSPSRFGGAGIRRLAVVFAVLAVATAAIGHFALPRTETPAPTVAPSAPSPLSPPVEKPRTSRHPSPAAPAKSALPAESALPAPVETRASSAPAVASVTPESRLAAESKLLEPAISALRKERDAARALTLLGRYEAEFPHGVLSLEARVLRVDSLLALGRRSDALAALDVLPLDRVGRGTELRLVRAELRAGADCRSALSDFDLVLSGGVTGAMEERALRGRALCRSSSGDAAGAKSDRERYLAKYPAGRFAAELRNAP